MQNSQQFEVGDRVYCMVMGQYGTVIGVDKDRYKRLTVQFEFDNVKYRFYGLDGRYTEAPKAPCLFFDKPQFEVPQKPFKATYKSGAVLALKSRASGKYWIVEVENTSFYEGKEEITGICRASSRPEDVGYHCQKTLDLYSISVISEPSE